MIVTYKFKSFQTYILCNPLKNIKVQNVIIFKS